jgi:ribosome-associated protein
MKNDLYIKNGISIPSHELEITATRSGGAGGQHVNKTSTRITIRWNLKNSGALTQAQKERALTKLQNTVTDSGDVVIHSSASRSQKQNKDMAVARLAEMIRKALHVSKKRIPTQLSQTQHAVRLEIKSRRSRVKKMRSTKITDD